ncbi:MAG: helix-turn-helix domain-containing protein [Candidatus Nanohaloarchaea archaeon]|nr:helix-turn-helix domain-containing protein [Candidatus Nanohaloarchaea archaeon]
MGYTIPDEVADVERDEAAREVYDFVAANEDGFYGVPDEPGVAMTEISRETGLDGSEVYDTLRKLEESGLLEKDVRQMDELAMDEKDEYDAITDRNDELPDDEFDWLYAVEDVYATSDFVSETMLVNGLTE